MSRSRFLWLLAGVLLLFLLVNAVWLALDHSISAWDDSFYLANSLRTYDALTDHGVPGLVHQYLFGMSAKAPLIEVLPIPAYLLFGRHPRVALIANLFLLAVLLTAVYLLGAAFGSRRAGMFALLVAGAMPMIYGMSRVYLVEVGLMALVTVGLLLVARWEVGAAPWMAPALGVVSGFGLLMKTSFPVFLAAPIAWLIIRRGRDIFTRGNIAGYLIPLGIIAGPWWAVNAGAAMHHALEAGSAESARIYHTGGLAETGRYLLSLANCGPALYFVALPVLAGLSMARIGKAARRGIRFCAVAAVPAVFLTFSHYRDVRFAAPLFPVVAVTVGILADTAMSRFPILATGMVGMVLTAGIGDMLYASFAARMAGLEGGLFLSRGGFSYVAPPVRDPSPYPDLLALLESRASFAAGPPRLVLASDTRYCNADNTRLAALSRRLPIDIQTTAYQDSSALPDLLASASFYAWAQGGAESALNPLGAISRTMVAGDPRFHPLTAVKLPDGSLLHVLAAEPRAAGRSGTLLKSGLDALPPCAVKFSDGIALVGLAWRPVPGGLEGRYRWRCLSRMQHDYWSFGHVLDAVGKVIGYLDHPILETTPTSRWEVGDSAIETVTVTVSGVPASVRLGVFDKESGEQLKVLSSNFPRTGSGTGVVSPVR